MENQKSGGEASSPISSEMAPLLRRIDQSTLGGLPANLWHRHIIPSVVHDEPQPLALQRILQLRRLNNGFNTMLHDVSTLEECLKHSQLSKELKERRLAVKYLTIYLSSLLSQNALSPQELDFLALVRSNRWTWGDLCDHLMGASDMCDEKLEKNPLLLKSCFIFLLSDVDKKYERLNKVGTKLFSLMMKMIMIDHSDDFLAEFVAESNRDQFYRANHAEFLQAIEGICPMVRGAIDCKDMKNVSTTDLSYAALTHLLNSDSAEFTVEMLFQKLARFILPEAYIRVLKAAQEGDGAMVEKILSSPNRSESFCVIADLALLIALLEQHISVAKRIMEMNVVANRDAASGLFCHLMISGAMALGDREHCKSLGEYLVRGFADEGSDLMALGLIAVLFSDVEDDQIKCLCAVLEGGLIAKGVAEFAKEEVGFAKEMEELNALRASIITIFMKECFKEDVNVASISYMWELLDDTSKTIIFFLVPTPLVRRGAVKVLRVLSKDPLMTEMLIQMKSIFQMGANEEVHNFISGLSLAEKE